MFGDTSTNRKSYTVKFKLGVIKDYESKNEDVTNNSVCDVAARYSIAPKMLLYWNEQKKHQEVLHSNNKSVIKCRNLLKSGRVTPFKEIDNHLINWVTELNQKGLVINGKYLKAKHSVL
ncbi:hypothetical protein DMUE_3940 [Dictyocoela muelleri]|nr:hypothetical protein DMUE_3940 [Dictyocoela muelleri]